MGPLEKVFNDRSDFEMDQGIHDEISHIWRHLDTMSESAAKPEITADAISEALRVAVEALEGLTKVVDEAWEARFLVKYGTWFKRIASDQRKAIHALARIKELTGETK